MLGLNIEGCRILRVLVSKKLARLTSVAGEVFVKAWLEVVRCTWIYDIILLTLSILLLLVHAFLWNRYVEHGDPSLWNVMYNKELGCGVLGDYDLSICRRKQRVPRTGTVPFMAIDLLTDEYWNGEIVRLYRMNSRPSYGYYPSSFCGTKMGNPSEEHLSTCG